MYQGKKAVVTGGMGFIGRNLVQGLLDAGARVVIVDDCSNSSSQPNASWRGDYTHIKQSVLQSEWLDELDDADYVFHLACKTILECNDEPDLDLKVNAESTLRILEHIRHLSGPKPSFLYASSASVYGRTPDFIIDESYPVAPCSQYGVSKLAGENYTSMYAKVYELPARSLRLSNVYGPGQTPNNPYCGVIGIFIRQSLDDQPLTVIGDGTQTRDFTYVTEVVKAIMLTASDSKTAGDIYNISTNTATPVIQIANEIISITGLGNIQSMPERQIDNILHREINSQKIAKSIGWENTVSIHEGLEQTISWFGNK